jgi:hypothetical protein
MDVLEINAITGEVVERDRTPAEQAQYEIDQATWQAAAAAAAEKEQADAQARTEAVEHAKSLGFTDAMIAVMYPNLGA